MKNNSNFIIEKIVVADPLANFSLPSADSSTALPEQPVMVTPCTAGSRNQPNATQAADTQDPNGPDMIAQIMDLEPHELQQAAAANYKGLTKVMRDAYAEYNTPKNYTKPPPIRDQPPPSTCLPVIHAWKAQLVNCPNRERLIRKGLGLPDANLDPTRNNKRRRKPGDPSHLNAPAAKQRRIPVGGLLKPGKEMRRGKRGYLYRKNNGSERRGRCHHHPKRTFLVTDIPRGTDRVLFTSHPWHSYSVSASAGSWRGRYDCPSS